MTGTTELRAAITGLIGLAATEEEMLLVSAPNGEDGSPDRWAAAPLVAHNAEFRQQQAVRLHAVLRGGTPPDFGETDHQSPDAYRRYCSGTKAEVTAASRQSASELIDGLAAVSDEDLSDASRHPWLRGRQLWLQIVVRGFWHPIGHLGDYYIACGRAAGPWRCSCTPWRRRGTSVCPTRRWGWPPTTWPARRSPPTNRPGQPPRSPRQSSSTRTYGQTPAVTRILRPSGLAGS